MSSALAEAYVQIRPDLTGFRDELRGELEEDTAGLDQRVRIDLDDDDFRTGLDSDRGLAKSFGDQKFSPKFEADDESLQRSMDENIAKAQELSDRVYSIKVRLSDTDAQVKLEELKAEADRLSSEVYEPEVTFRGVDNAKRDLDDLENQLGDVERAADGASGSGGGGGGLAGLGQAGAGASEGLSPLLGVAAGLAPALIPIGAAATAALGGILSLATGAGAGLAGVGIVSADVLGKVFSAVTNLQTAQQNYNKAVASGNKSGETTALRAETAAYVGLDAGQRKAATSLVDLKDHFSAFANQFQPQIFQLFDQGISLASGLMTAFTPIIKGSFGALEGLTKEVEKVASGPEGKKFISFLTTEAPLGIQVFGQALLSIGEGFAGIVEAFAPFSKILGGGIDEAAAKFAKFGESLSGSSGFKSFMEYVKQNGPVIGAFFKELVVVAGELLVALAPLGTAILKVLVLTAPAIEGAVKLIGDFARGIAALITVALPVFKAIATGIATVIDWLAKLFSSGKNLEAGLNQVWADIKTGASAAWQEILSVTRTVWGSIESFFEGFWADTRGVFTSSLSTVRNALTSSWSAITGTVRAVWNAIKAFFTTIWADIVGIFTSGTSHVTERLTSTWSSITGAIHATWSAIVSFFSSTWGRIAGVFAAGIASVVGFLAGLPGRAVSAVAALAGDLGSVARNAMAAFLNAIEAGAASAVGYVAGIPGQLLGALGNLGSLLFSDGQQIVQGLIDGIESMIGKAVGEISKLGGLVHDASSLFHEIFSPSKLYMRDGVYIVQGLIQGIQQTTPAAVAAITSLGKQIHNAFPVNSLSGAAIPASLGGATGWGGASITYSPSITVQGDVGPEGFTKQIRSELDAHDVELQRWIGRF